jgi:hypothetical protein
MDRSAIVYVTIAYLAIALMEGSDVSIRKIYLLPKELPNQAMSLQQN